MDERVKRRAPAVIIFFSVILERALPMKGLRTKEETLETPTRTPISASVAPDLER